MALTGLTPWKRRESSLPPRQDFTFRVRNGAAAGWSRFLYIRV